MEKKAIKIVQKKHGELYSSIDKIRYKVMSVLDSKDKETKIVLNPETLKGELESILDNKLHSIHEWLHALEKNH